MYGMYPTRYSFVGTSVTISNLHPRVWTLAMADSESNPAYLIIGIVSTLVLVFFVGNIWACVLPASRPAASSARGVRPAVSQTSRPSVPPPGSFGLTLSSPCFLESGTRRPRSATQRSRRRRWAPRNARARCSRRACSRRESRLDSSKREEMRETLKTRRREEGETRDAKRICHTQST